MQVAFEHPPERRTIFYIQRVGSRQLAFLCFFACASPLLPREERWVVRGRENLAPHSPATSGEVLKKKKKTLGAVQHLAQEGLMVHLLH